MRLVIAALLLCAAADAGLCDDWVTQLDTSRLEFVADYVGAEVPGRFERFDVELRFDPERPDEGRLVVTVDVASVDLGDPDLTTTVAEEAWFDAAAFATARFSSEAIEASGKGTFVAAGVLELKGMAREVVVPFSWDRSGDEAIMRGEATLRRLDFGIGVAVEEVGDIVRVPFEVSLRTD